MIAHKCLKSLSCYVHINCQHLLLRYGRGCHFTVKGQGEHSALRTERSCVWSGLEREDEAEETARNQGEKGGKKQGVVKRASPCEGQKMSRRKREFRSQLPNDKREKLTGRWTVRLSSQQLIRNAFWYTMTEQIFSG